MIELKEAGHWRVLWSTFNESVQLMVEGEVVIQSMWSPAVTAVREQGVPCIYQDLKEGYRSWTLGHLMPKHVEGKKLGAVYDYVTWYHSGPAGAFFARQGYYVVTPSNTQKHLPEAEWDFWFEGKPATVDIYSPFGKLMEKPGAVRDGGSYKNPHGAASRCGTRSWTRTSTSPTAGTSSSPRKGRKHMGVRGTEPPRAPASFS